jgi:hypothetical protein
LTVGIFLTLQMLFINAKDNPAGDNQIHIDRRKTGVIDTPPPIRRRIVGARLSEGDVATKNVDPLNTALRSIILHFLATFRGPIPSKPPPVDEYRGSARYVSGQGLTHR